MRQLQVAPPASASDEIENRDANAIYRDDRFSALPDEVIIVSCPLFPSQMSSESEACRKDAGKFVPRFPP